MRLMRGAAGEVEVPLQRVSRVHKHTMLKQPLVAAMTARVWLIVLYEWLISAASDARNHVGKARMYLEWTDLSANVHAEPHA